MCALVKISHFTSKMLCISIIAIFFGWNLFCLNVSALDTTTDLTIKDLHWNSGTFVKDAWQILVPTDGGSFVATILDDALHVKEVDTFDCLTGIYTTVPVTNGHLVVSFEAKAEASSIDAKNLALRLIDPSSKLPIQHIPIVGYLKDGLKYSDFHHFGVDFPLQGYDEVIIMFYYYDSWLMNYNQEFWIRNLIIHKDGILPTSQNLEILPINEDNFVIDSFYNDNFHNPNIPLTHKPAQHFEYSIINNELRISEVDSGCYNSIIGAYVRLPVISYKVQFSFLARVTADPGKMPFIIYRFYDPNTKERLLGLPDVTCWTAANNALPSDTDYVRIELSVYVPGYEEVLVLIGFNDVYEGNNNFTFSLKDFRCFQETETNTLLIIYPIGDLFGCLGTISLLIGVAVARLNRRQKLKL